MWISKKEIEELSEFIKNADKDELQDIRDNKEGAFSVLKNDIYNLVTARKEELDILRL